MARKILFFYQSPEIGGGVDTVLINLIKSWPDKTDKLVVWLNGGHKGKYLYDSLGVEVRKIPLSAEGDTNHQGVSALWHKFLRIFKYSYFKYAIFKFYLALKKESPDVFFAHNGGYPGGELSLASVIAAKLANVPKIYLVVHNNALSLKWPFKFVHQCLDKIIEHSCTKIISVSASCAQQIKETRFAASHKIDFVYNGIITLKTKQLSLVDKKKKLNLNDAAQVIGCIGDYEERKGHEYLIRAFNQVQKDFPQSKLIIIGSKSPAHTLMLEKLIEELHLEGKVLLTGYLDAAWEYIECFDLFVFPSIAFESFGMVLLEAMLYKKPIIATKVGGIPEVLGDTGILVEPKEVEPIACAITKILSDKPLAMSMGEKGYQRLIHEFQAERMAQKYDDLIK